MKKIILLFILVSSCTNQTVSKVFDEKIDIYENLSFEQFKLKVLNYAKNSNFPDIKN